MLALAALLATLALVPEDAKPPTGKELDQLAETYLTQDARTSAGRMARHRALRRLDLAPPLSEKEVEAWTAKLLKLATRGPKLEKKSGRHHFWSEPEERGLYIVGGETNRPKALLIAMHGGGAGEGDAGSAQGVYQAAAGKLDWLMICPEVLEKTEHGWTDSGSEEFVLGLVDAALRTWKIDRNRVYLSGHSMGGYGTWTIGSRHADRVAALAASAGAPTPVFGPERTVIDVETGVVPCLRNVPMVVYQSDDDPQVPPEANRAAAKKVGEAREQWGGFPFEYWEVEGRGHDLPPGGMAALLAKIEKQVRDPRPRKVVWQPSQEWKRQFYWLWWSDPAVGSTVVAECASGGNEIVVTCTAIPKGLEVLLDERLVDLEKEVVVKLGDQVVYRGTPIRTLANLVRTAETGDPDLVFSASVPLAP